MVSIMVPVALFPLAFLLGVVCVDLAFDIAALSSSNDRLEEASFYYRMHRKAVPSVVIPAVVVQLVALFVILVKELLSSADQRGLKLLNLALLSAGGFIFGAILIPLEEEFSELPMITSNLTHLEAVEQQKRGLLLEIMYYHVTCVVLILVSIALQVFQAANERTDATPTKKKTK
ncbi:hypothetical protein QOT17_016390 [Balamuthia mandrillaris]